MNFWREEDKRTDRLEVGNAISWRGVRDRGGGGAAAAAAAGAAAARDEGSAKVGRRDEEGEWNDDNDDDEGESLAPAEDDEGADDRRTGVDIAERRVEGLVPHLTAGLRQPAGPAGT